MSHSARTRSPWLARPLLPVVALLVAGGLTVTPAAASPSPTAVDPEGAVFEDGMAQPVFADDPVLRSDAWVEVDGVDTDRDGLNDRIHVEVARPASTDDGVKMPAIIEASPYNGGLHSPTPHDPNVELYVAPPGGDADAQPLAAPELDGVTTGADGAAIGPSSWERYFLPRGFTYIYASTLGTEQSTGCPTFGDVQEDNAMKAVIDWLNGRAPAYSSVTSTEKVEAYWATGEAGMMGVSYDGTLPIQAALTGVDGLEAIVPISAISSWYDYRRANGATISSDTNSQGDQDWYFDSITTPEAQERCAFDRAEIAEGMNRVTGNYNQWWDDRNFLNRMGNVHAAVLIEQGINDWNVKTKHFAQFYSALREQGNDVKLWLHQGGHGDRANRVNRTEWRNTVNKWFSHFLYGVDNDILDTPRVKIEREDNTWVDYPDWPAPEAAAARLSPNAGGTGIGGLSFQPADPSITESLTDDSSIRADTLADAASSPNRLVYQTGELAAPIRLSGTPYVNVRVAITDKPVALVSGMVVDYGPDGTGRIITRGWMDPQSRESLEYKVPIEQGEFYSLRINLMPKDYVFPAGHRIGLMFTSTDHVFTLRPSPGAHLTFDLADTSVDLPLVGGAPALAQALGEPACDTTITGRHTGPLTVGSGVTCLTGATQTGPVRVNSGGSLVATGSRITGPVFADHARVLSLTDTTVTGPLSLTGGTGYLNVSDADITGPVSLTGNSGSQPVISGSTVTGPLSCQANDPVPVNLAAPNTVRGPVTGQCRGL